MQWGTLSNGICWDAAWQKTESRGENRRATFPGYRQLCGVFFTIWIYSTKTYARTESLLLLQEGKVRLWNTESDTGNACTPLGLSESRVHPDHVGSAEVTERSPGPPKQSLQKLARVNTSPSRITGVKWALSVSKFWWNVDIPEGRSMLLGCDLPLTSL